MRNDNGRSTAHNMMQQSTDYGQNGNNMATGAGAYQVTTTLKPPTPPLTWTPPILLLDYGTKARLVTQADVDAWIQLEREHDFLLTAILEHIPAKRLRAYVEKLPKEG